jgi:hypothetical protein
MEEETEYAQGGSRGGLQKGYQRPAQNIHFMTPHTMMTAMGVPSIVAFKVEAIEPNSKYERRQALRRLEKPRQPFRGRSLEVAELPSLGLSNEGITITYPHKNKSNSLHMSQPSQFVGIPGTKRGTVVTTKKQRKSMWIEAHHHGASYVGR